LLSFQPSNVKHGHVKI